MNIKKLMPIPIALLVVCSIYLLFLVETNSLSLDIDFKGGTQITAESNNAVSETQLESVLSQYNANVRTARGLTSYAVFIEFDSSIKPEDVLNTLQQNGYTFNDYSVQSTGPTLGASFFQQAIFVLIFSFIFMAVTVFIMFKNPLPSLFLVLTPVSDIIETLVISQIFGINLSLATFSALLLLIGYSVDDNILMTARVLKGEILNIDENIRSSFKTGMTMVGATLVALLALFIISTSTVIDQIASILLIGLIVDLVNSWVLNTGLLKWFVERKKK